MTFWPHPRDRGCVVGQNFYFHGALCSIPLNLRIFRKKWFDQPTPGSRVCLWAKIFATMLLHASSALIRYATWQYSEKCSILALAQPPKSTPGDWTQAFRLNPCLIFFISIVLLPACIISAKILPTALFIAKFNIWFVCLFDLILNVPSTIFQLYRDGSSWVEPVLS